MKKKLLISVMVIIALIGTMAGCQTKFSEQDLFEIASYKVSAPDRDVFITIKDKDTVVFNLKNGKVEKSVEGVNFKNLIKDEAGDSLVFDQSYFANPVFQAGKIKALYTADIVNVEEFLGIADATDARIEIMVSIENQSLISMRIYYKIAKKLAVYDVAIAVLAK